ncbi:NAD(P)-binding protein [Clavulina sp. PMI_390]|nr:NAD(P)-binding protein [Clavulina sp. PMI_390]
MAHQGKVVIITGGASGLGKHLAAALHSQGATLVLADINEELGMATAAELNAKRANSTIFIRTDVTSWDDQVHLFRTTMSNPLTPRIDYVYANAGLYETAYLPPMTSSSPDAIDWSKPALKAFEVNSISVLYTCQLAAQVMRTQSIVNGFRGKIIATASIAGFAPIEFMPQYSAAKHSVVGLVRAFAPQVALHNITINGVGPNVTRSNLAPKVAFDEVEAMGMLTPNENVTEAFLSFLGDSTENGLVKEVSMDDIVAPPLPKPLNPQVRDNLAFLGEAPKMKYIQESTALRLESQAKIAAH